MRPGKSRVQIAIAGRVAKRLHYRRSLAGSQRLVVNSELSPGVVSQSGELKYGPVWGKFPICERSICCKAVQIRLFRSDYWKPGAPFLRPATITLIHYKCMAYWRRDATLGIPH
jgi:hypothetical protein